MQLLTSALGGYTADQLEAALRRGVLALSPRFEVLDQALGHIGNLSTVQKASVEMNVDRDIKGALTLTMLPDPLLPYSTSPFSRYIKPWFRCLMFDGGYAEWAQGCFFWTKPHRDLPGTGSEQWSLTCGDRSHALTVGGPGPLGYTIAAGTRQTDAIITILQTVFGPDVDISRIVASSSVTAAPIARDIVADTPAATDSNSSGTPGTMWSDILQPLAASLGYYSLWFDANGSPVSEPVPDLASAPADVTYSNGKGSLLQNPVAVDADLSSLANRVFVRQQSASPDAPFLMGSADLNDLIPGHPYSQAMTGLIYIDAVLDDTTASTQDDLDARARAELYARASMYQKVGAKTQAWPVHEAFDIVGLQYDGDADFDTEKTLHEAGWTLDLFTGDTSRSLRRIAP